MVDSFGDVFTLSRGTTKDVLVVIFFVFLKLSLLICC